MIKDPITGYPVAPWTRWRENVSTPRQGQRNEAMKGALGEEKRDYTNSSHERNNRERRDYQNEDRQTEGEMNDGCICAEKKVLYNGE